MPDQPIPPHVRALLAERIDSVGQLEVLLALRARPASARSAADVAAELRTNPAWAEAELATLAARGLLVAEGPTYRFAPATPALATAVEDLARAYTDRRVSVIGLIFSKPPPPPAPLRTFADAFRLRPPSPPPPPPPPPTKEDPGA